MACLSARASNPSCSVTFGGHPTNSAPRPSDYVNKLARVTIPITHPDKGEVAAHVRTARRCLPAVAAGETKSFRIGDEVVIVGYRAGVARVVAREEYEEQPDLERGVIS